MRKILSIIVATLVLMSCKNQEENLKNKASIGDKIAANKSGESIHQFKVKDINGNEFDFASLKGKKVLIVNTASKCGLAPQFEQLQTLYSEFEKENFVVVAFPSNSFDQEPANNEEIATICSKDYGVTFPVMDKISVKGDDKHELYQFLTQKSKNGLEDNDVKWNFQKYLINEEGRLDKVLVPQILPIDQDIIDWIKA
jgi:glutathione peroxidase